MSLQQSGRGIVRYGSASLADVLPSALNALGIPDEPNQLELPVTDCVVVLLVDGLGWNLLQDSAIHAPFLTGLTGRELTAGFPTTTATSICSLGTGLPAGKHGLTGYQSRLVGLAEPINWLTWRGAASGKDLLADYPPEQLQTADTAFERARRAGVAATAVAAPAFSRSGLTRSALRGADYLPAFTAADQAIQVAQVAHRRGGLIYCYLTELDLIGHVYGCRSEAWQAQLEFIDRAVQLLADRLPDNTTLLVTADHGMVDIDDAAKVDYDAEPVLTEGIELLAGEARARYLHVQPGQLPAVRQRWQDRLGERARLVTRDEAIELGWFGPRVTNEARHRIGDLIALAVGELAIVRRKAESRTSALIGHHGALTEAELLVPLLTN